LSEVIAPSKSSTSMSEPGDEPTRRAIGLAVSGIALTLAGVVGYFVVVLRFGGLFPGIRNDALPSWVLVAFGLGLAGLAVQRATRGRRALATAAAVVNVIVAGAFVAMLTVGLALPSAAGPSIGFPAPSFTLADQTGRTVRLEDFRGAPLLLVFYRGHW
jgi:hypothetical protein